MPLNALANPLVLPILGLLVEHSRHQYALLSELRARYPFLPVKTSTVYTLVKSLVRQGLADLGDATDGSGRQQVTLTASGFAELRRSVEWHLLHSDPNVDAKFATALAYLGVLTPEQAACLLRERAERLRSNLQALTESLDRTDLREIHMIEAHFLTSRLEHELTWLTQLAKRIENHELDWPDSNTTIGLERGKLHSPGVASVTATP